MTVKTPKYGDYTSPRRGAFTITPHDSNALAETAYAIYVGVAGDLKVTHVDGSTITYENVPVGWFPVIVSLVFATGTAASDLVGGRI